MVHIGHGKWLSKPLWDNAMRSSKPSACVNNILIAVFGEETLIKSTITGKLSNASHKYQSSDDKAPDRPKKLDPSLLKLCQDWFGYWLRLEYPKYNTNFNLLKEFNSFPEYATKKIAYMKRIMKSKNISKRGKCKTISSDSENYNDEEENKKLNKKFKLIKVVRNDEQKNEQNQLPDLQIAGTSQEVGQFVYLDEIIEKTDENEATWNFSPVHESDFSENNDPLK